jgi:hypothetical protein
VTAPLTKRQIDLARHALGLPNKDRQSYRNSFVGGPGHADYDDWYAMAKAAYAVRRDGALLRLGGNDLFHLTRAGAEAALVGRETLDPEDVPAEAVAP